jgi:hypothetical protein
MYGTTLQQNSWSMLVHCAQAINGDWKKAWEGVAALPQDAFEGAGGDGHSLTNTLWFIATRPDRKPSSSSNSTTTTSDKTN